MEGFVRGVMRSNVLEGSLWPMHRDRRQGVYATWAPLFTLQLLPSRRQRPHSLRLQMLRLSWDSGLSSRLGAPGPYRVCGDGPSRSCLWRRSEPTLWRRDCMVCSHSLSTQTPALPQKQTDPSAGPYCLYHSCLYTKVYFVLK